MSSTIYLLLLLPVIGGIIIVLFINNKRNSHTELYSEGMRNENDGRYNLALHNYEDALVEIRKLKTDNKFGEKIVQKIRVLRATIDYEKNFQRKTEQDTIA